MLLWFALLEVPNLELVRHGAILVEDPEALKDVGAGRGMRGFRGVWALIRAETLKNLLKLGDATTSTEVARTNQY